VDVAADRDVCRTRDLLVDQHVPTWSERGVHPDAELHNPIGGRACLVHELAEPRHGRAVLDRRGAAVDEDDLNRRRQQRRGGTGLAADPDRPVGT
jgi:hypothetical protein